MQREPSVHITRTKLIGILADCQVEGHKKLADIILKKGSNYSLNHRSVIVSNDKIKRDVNRIAKSSKGDTKLLSKLILFIRKNKLKQRGVKPTDINNKQQLTLLSNLCNSCIEFCNEFNLKKKKGFTVYLEIGLPKISSSRNLLQKLNQMYEAICQIYESEQIIEDDREPKYTRSIHDYYIGKIQQDTGIYKSFVDEPNVYKCFVGVKEIVKKYKVPYEMYIDAQFIGLSFTDSIASPYQLMTEKAVDRLNNYLYKNKLKVESLGEKKISLKGVDILKKIKG